MRLLFGVLLTFMLTAPAFARSTAAVPPFNLGSRLHHGRGYIVVHHPHSNLPKRTTPAAAMKVIPENFDPYHTHLVVTEWHVGLGCPTNAAVEYYPSSPSTYTDPACLTGDAGDHTNFGLLLTKTGPTGNFAAAQAEVTNVTGLTLTEIGWDLRTGSHCGNGAPRFDIVTTDSVDHFIGCDSPPPTVLASSQGWQRLRYDPSQAFPPIDSPVQSIFIIMDEGNDTGPDFSGQSVIDNIDINGALLGRQKG